MNYRNIYSILINKALTRQLSEQFTPGQFYERHHILPKSMGGKDTEGNLVWLTVREHYLSHLILWKMNNPNQIFSVECFLRDSIDPNKPHRFNIFRYKKWLRRAIAYQRAENVRNTRKITLAKRFTNGMEQIEAEYITDLFKVAGSEGIQD